MNCLTLLIPKVALLSFAFLPPKALSQEYTPAFTGTWDHNIQLGYAAWGYGSGIILGYDLGIAPFISAGIGGQFYYKPLSSGSPVFLAGRVNIHIFSLWKATGHFDLYIGPRFNYYNNRFGLGVGGGLRYHFGKHWGVFADFSNVSGVGVFLRFGNEDRI